MFIHQFLMCTYFFHFTLIQYDNLICSRNRFEFVGNHNDGKVVLPQPLLPVNTINSPS